MEGKSGGGEFVATLIVIGVGFFILWYLRQQQQNQQVLTQPPPLGKTFTPTGPPVAEQIAISSIPVVGPALNYTVVKAGNAIAGSQFLTENSQVAPGRSVNQAGVLYVGTHWQNGGLVGLSKTVGSGIETGAKKVGSALEFWNW